MKYIELKMSIIRDLQRTRNTSMYADKTAQYRTQSLITVLRVLKISF